MSISGKFMPPPTDSGTINRSQLNLKFDAAFAKGPIFISAQAGYGKSLSVLEWLNTNGLPYAWLNIDELDNTLFELCESLRKSLTTLSGKFQNKTEGEPFKTLLNEIACLSNIGGAVLVLDDLHMITSRDVMHHVILFVKRLPRCIKTFILSRREPPREFVDMILSGGMSVITKNDLMFDKDEIKIFFL